MMEWAPQEAMALILPMGGTFFLGVVTLFTVVVFLLKNKGVAPWVGLACLGLPIWGSLGIGLLGAKEAQGWASEASLAPVISLLLCIGLCGSLMVPLAWKGIRAPSSDTRSFLWVGLWVCALSLCLYMQAQVMYDNMVTWNASHEPFRPPKGNVVTYVRMGVFVVLGGLFSLTCLGRGTESHRQARVVAGGSFALLVCAGEIGHVSLQDYMGLMTLPKGVVANQLDPQEAVAMSYAMFNGEGAWSGAVLALAMSLWGYVVYTCREPEGTWPKQSLVASMWFLFPVVWLWSPPVSQDRVLNQVVLEVAALNEAAPPVVAEEPEASPIDGTTEEAESAPE